MISVSRGPERERERERERQRKRERERLLFPISVHLVVSTRVKAWAR